jgi:hypothetical protein
MRGLGSLAYSRGGHRHLLDLGTCRDTVGGPARGSRPGPAVSRDGRSTARVEVVAGRQSIVVSHAGGGGRAVLIQPAWSPAAPNRSPGPLMLLGYSGDGGWVLFANDPMGSASIVADGILMRAVSLRGDRVREVATLLGYDDYRAWCGGRLVLISGGGRVATRNKRIVAAGPPSWKPRPLVRGVRHAWGSVACAPDGRSVVAQAQEPSVFAQWSLWRVGFDHSVRRLTSPPTGYSDDSPRFGPDGRTLFFVRSRRDTGRVYALRDGKLLGPFATVGPDTGYYGHHDWPYSVRR